MNGDTKDEYRDIVNLLRGNTKEISNIERLVLLDGISPPLVSAKVDREQVERIELAHLETSLILDPNELDNLENRLDTLADRGYLTKSVRGVYQVSESFRALVESASQK